MECKTKRDSMQIWNRKRRQKISLGLDLNVCGCMYLCCTFYVIKMDLFSLEEDKCPELFITQESNKVDEDMYVEESGKDEEFLGIKMNDFGSPCTSLMGLPSMHYLGISNDKMIGENVPKDKELG